MGPQAGCFVPVPTTGISASPECGRAPGLSPRPTCALPCQIQFWQELYGVRGGVQDELPHALVKVAAKRIYPMSKEQQLSGNRRAERSYSMFKVRRGGSEAIPLVQSKEQHLHFVGASMKRYPMSKVREIQVRRYVLQEGIRGQTH